MAMLSYRENKPYCVAVFDLRSIGGWGKTQ